MKRMVRNVFRNLMFCASLMVAAGTAQALPYSNIVVFGDSLSDTGNRFADTGAPPAPYYDKQFSNGPVWANIFAQHFGLDATASSFGGSNYAYAGATTGNTGVPTRDAPTLLTQRTNYLTAQGGAADPNALYVVFGGANDLADALLTNNTSLIGSGIGNVVNIITSLYGAGAKNLLVVNAPDIGKTPRVGAFGPAAQGAGTLLASTWNSALSSALGSLSTLPGIDLDMFDLFGLQQATLADPAAFGFTNVTTPCFNGVSVCSNPDEYFFWDDFHPSARAHQFIALAAIGDVPEPAVIFLLGIGFVGMMVVRKRSV